LPEKAVAYLFFCFYFWAKAFSFFLKIWVKAILHFQFVNNIWGSFCQLSQIFWHAFKS
jgi:hypothetical protein